MPLSFCDKIGLSYYKKTPAFIKEENIDTCILADENIFDIDSLYLLASEKLKSLSVKLKLGTEANLSTIEKYDYAIIATYTNNNDFLQDYPSLAVNYQYELCEKPIVKMSNQFAGKGVVIMDGPFMCFDPYGRTDFHVMGNVVHAIHDTHIGKSPNKEVTFKFKSLLNRGIVPNPSITKFPKFFETASSFFTGISDLEHIGSMYTYRVVLPNMEDTDERPTLVRKIKQ